MATVSGKRPSWTPLYRELLAEAGRRIAAVREACTTVGMPALLRMWASAAAWSWCECTPPSEMRPIMWQGAARGLELRDQSVERRRLLDLVRRDGVSDARQVLHDDAAGADVEMADLGIAHLAVGQTDILAGGARGHGHDAHRASKLGLLACRTALSALSSRHPQPSRIASITGRFFCMSNVFPFARADGGGVETDSAPIGHECERFAGLPTGGQSGRRGGRPAMRVWHYGVEDPP